MPVVDLLEVCISPQLLQHLLLLLVAQHPILDVLQCTVAIQEAEYLLFELVLRT
jgi:hypothetical protein